MSDINYNEINKTWMREKLKKIYSVDDYFIENIIEWILMSIPAIQGATTELECNENKIRFYYLDEFLKNLQEFEIKKEDYEKRNK